MSKCITKDCNLENYSGKRKCVLHCDKTDFPEHEIDNFWSILRETHIKYDYRDFVKNEEIVLNKIHFPKFQNYNTYHNKNNFNQVIRYIRGKFTTKMLFQNCVFYDVCDFSYYTLESEFIFNRCTFKSSFNVKSFETLKLIKCEFKDDIYLNDSPCINLTIDSSTFNKKVKLLVTDKFILKDSIFKNDLHVQGKNNLELILKDTQISKNYTTQNMYNETYVNLIVKGESSFLSNSNKLNLQDCNFNKDVTFIQLYNLNAQKVTFNSLVTFNNKDIIPEIVFDHTNFNKEAKICNVNKLNFSVINFLENCKILNIYEKLSLMNINSKKDFHLENIKNTDIKNSSFLDNFSQMRECNDFLVLDSNFENINLHITNLCKLNKVSINTYLSLEAGNYKTIEINDSNINDKVTISGAENINIQKLKTYPSINIQGNEKTIVTIDNSRIDKFYSNNLSSLKVLSSTTIKTLELEKIKNISLSNTKIKESCSFPQLEELEIKKDSIIFKEIKCNSAKSINIENSILKENLIFDNYIESLFISESECLGKIVDSNFGITRMIFSNSIFKNELNFSNSKYHYLLISNSKIEGKINFKESTLEQIEIKSTPEFENIKTILNDDIDFSFAEVNRISIESVIFNGNVLFNNIKNIFEFNNLNNINFNNRILINKTKLIDLFLDVENIFIGELTISGSELLTSDNLADKIGKKEIYLNKLRISRFKMKEILFHNNINFEDLEVDSFEIINSNIEKIFRLRKCFIKEFLSSDNIFEDLQIIDNQYNKQKSIKRNIELSNTTVKSGVFDKLKFDNFVMNDAHVSEAKIGYVKFEQASRETNRFFKNYYDSISDYITANEYYQKEMKEQTKNCQNLISSEWWILSFNKWISNFGQNWLLPIFWMIIVTLLSYRVVNFNLLSIDGFIENHVFWMINDIVKFSNPFSKTALSNYGLFYWVWMLHKLLMTVFIYHFVIAVKRKTKR